MGNKEDSLKNKSGSWENQGRPVSNNKSGDFNKYAAIAIIAFLVGLGLSWSLAKNSETANEKSDVVGAEKSKKADNITRDGVIWPSDVKDVMTVFDQEPGLEVKIDRLNTPKSVWVAIHEDNGQGEPGNILGAQLFDVGTASGTVELLRGTEAGGTYYAMIHDDNGDRAFIPKMDAPILNAEGKPIMVIFKTTTEVLPAN